LPVPTSVCMSICLYLHLSLCPFACTYICWTRKAIIRAPKAHLTENSRVRRIKNSLCFGLSSQLCSSSG
jgi:hypothetical protein